MMLVISESRVSHEGEIGRAGEAFPFRLVWRQNRLVGIFTARQKRLRLEVTFGAVSHCAYGCREREFGGS